MNLIKNHNKCHKKPTSILLQYKTTPKHRIHHKIIKNILGGNPFSGENIQTIRKLGYAVLVVGFGSGIVEGLAAWEILRLLPETIPAFQVKATFDSRLLLGSALLIFLLVQIWSYGLELEREQALTI